MTDTKVPLSEMEKIIYMIVKHLNKATDKPVSKETLFVEYDKFKKSGKTIKEYFGEDLPKGVVHG